MVLPLCRKTAELKRIRKEAVGLNKLPCCLLSGWRKITEA